MRIKNIGLSVLLLGYILVIAGCAPSETDLGTDTDVTSAVAVLHPTEGNSVEGTVTFTQVENGIRIVADVTGLEPGQHGFHIHEYGDCTAPDGTSAGGHFNPHGVEHGGPDDAVRHVGDLSNLDAGENGQAEYQRVDTVITFSGMNNILGRAIIIHAGSDDLTSQPTGAAGSRLACGVIGIAQPSQGM